MFETSDRLRYISVWIEGSSSSSLFPEGTYPAPGGAITLYLGDGSTPTPLYLSTGGTLTVDKGGLTGTLSAQLEPQGGPTSPPATPPQITVSGNWRCI